MIARFNVIPYIPMARSNQARSRKDAHGRRGGRRASWVGPFRRVNRALVSSARLLESARQTVEGAWDSCLHSPVRTSRELCRVSARLADAKVRLERALRGLTATSGCFGAKPEQAECASRLLIEASVRSLRIACRIEDTSAEVFQLHTGVLECLDLGRLEPERADPAAKRRPRIILTPRTIPAREFLLCHRSSARDRIASVPTPRRRARVASADAPRRISRGRAPPSASTCPL